MRFTVLPHGAVTPRETPNSAYLTRDGWDDWFRFSTQYYLTIVDRQSVPHEIGFVKIGQTEMGPLQRRADLPETFEHLDGRFFSIGQDASYYEELNRLGVGTRTTVLTVLNDMAFKEEIFEKALEEEVTTSSLLRSVSRKTVTGQFRRLANGGARVTQFSFDFRPPSQAADKDLKLTFNVFPESQPPTNIHVLIGRNGVGKTRLLQRMTQTLATASPTAEYGDFIDKREDKAGTLFANVVSVSFSAFDDFDPLGVSGDKSNVIPYSYVGLKQQAWGHGQSLPPKSPQQLGDEFSASVAVCLGGPRQERWRRALQMLESDPIFNEAQVAHIADDSIDERELTAKAKSLFSDLSSGHKIVLLTITRLVETVEEGSLILLDEPEAHLHPPLLGAFMRVLSDLLKARNGVAIVVTHSPVILQEVPKSNVWILRRSGRILNADRPTIETFAENVGVLTREVFGLEAIQSGFHRLLGEAVDRGLSYEQVIDHFGGQLGGEGRLIVQSLIALRDPAPISPFFDWTPNVEG